ncbi:Oxygen tolerance [Sulfurivirga caldicuralii]|uniref:Oxygen tolerance n=1 Tax=Sulfurivirga caldicuralii TaxID=364032 RepID=A0A1N6HCQ3_9GAMM|nr:BatD family protein [Sulfurivirga caldicuralii]SIO17533.1 Oxygen tolerance [Sulfurivirga caldicuralii]
MVSALRGLILMGLLILSASALATTLEAEVDRAQVEMGDVITLTVTARDLSVTQSLPAPDFSVLDQDFRRLAQENNTQLMVANGAMRKFEQWRVQLSPKRTGILTIPPIRVGKMSTRPLTVNVKPASNSLKDHPAYFLDNSVSPQTLYVQQQGLYMLRFYYRGDLINGAVAPPTFGTAQVLRLANQATYRKLVDGLPYTVFEWRYAFFPTEAGTLTIPPQGFQGQLYLDQRLRQVSGNTQPLSVKVLPIPNSWPDGTPWLPAHNLTLKARWIGIDKPLKAGDTATLELTIDADGQRATLIPDLPMPKVDGIRFYTEPPQLDNDLRTDGVHGRKVLRWTLLFEKPGELTLPALALAWWDVNAKHIRKATLPARTFHIEPAASRQTLKAIEPKNKAPVVHPGAPQDSSALQRWQLATAAATLLALVFMGLWWRQRRLSVRTTHQTETGDTQATRHPTGRKQSDLCHLAPKAFYRTLLQQRDRWPQDRNFTEAMHTLERALLVEPDTHQAEAAKETLCRLIEQIPAKKAPPASTLKPLYPDA